MRNYSSPCSETIIVTARRCGEVLRLRLDRPGRDRGLPTPRHDQTKVGNYDEAIRIPERVDETREARQRKTLAVFQERNSRPPTAAERALTALFPTNLHTRDCRYAVSYSRLHRGFKTWIDEPRHRPPGARPGPSLPGHQPRGQSGA